MSFCRSHHHHHQQQPTEKAEKQDGEEEEGDGDDKGGYDQGFKCFIIEYWILFDRSSSIQFHMKRWTCKLNLQITPPAILYFFLVICLYHASLKCFFKKISQHLLPQWQ